MLMPQIFPLLGRHQLHGQGVNTPFQLFCQTFVDQPVPAIVLDQLMALAHVKTAKSLQF